MNPKDLRTRAHIEVVKSLLIEFAVSNYSVPMQAKAIVEKLEQLDENLIHPPGQPPVIPAYGDARSQAVMDALLAKPAVLYGVLGILHNYKVAGPWEHTTERDTRHPDGGGAPVEEITERWARVDARKGSAVAVIYVIPERNLLRMKGPGLVKYGEDRRPSELPEAMAELDTYLGVERGWILVPGVKER